jgi:hypothetical protein
MDVYFVCVPKRAFENLTLPISTRPHKLRNGQLQGGKLIESMKLKKRWKYASKKAKLDYVGMGAHHLRSAFHTQAVRANVDDRILLFQLGKGGDKFGYVRPEEQDVVRELRKVWEYSSTAAALDEKNKELGQKVEHIQSQVDEIRKGGLGPLTKEDLRRMVEQFVAEKG